MTMMITLNLFQRRSLLFWLALAGLSGCSSLGVEPWQRDILAQPAMRFDAGGPMTTFKQHFYFSKEASSGGQGFAGGGCGCN